MIVVSNTTPLNYLILVGAPHILPALFQQVYLPRQVVDELQDVTAPQPVRDWIAAPPPWLLVRSSMPLKLEVKLDEGEMHAISLAEELHADHILIDEWAARAVATNRGLHVIGTLGVLDQAAQRDLIALKDVFDRLLQTNFRIDVRLIDQLLAADAARRTKNE
jgi:predicted nucleic acid-binding protein